MIKTREQRYAEPIYGKVESFKLEADQLEADKKKKLVEEYSAVAKNLPVLIRTAGLVQALYFAATRSEGSKRLIEDLAESLGKRNKSELLDSARTAALDEYIRLTEQCLAALKWFKRFAGVHLDH